jgi:hypothetical protein
MLVLHIGSHLSGAKLQEKGGLRRGPPDGGFSTHKHMLSSIRWDAWKTMESATAGASQVTKAVLQGIARVCTAFEGFPSGSTSTLEWKASALACPISP